MYMFRSFVRGLVVLIASLLLAGCYGEKGISDLQAFMDDIKNQPHGRIDPLPEFHAYEAFTYKATDLRSPFTKPIVVEVIQTEIKETFNLYPDFDRTKEYLERFAITTLSMVGTLSMQDDVLWALMSDENGDVHRVKEGNYIGQNHGEVIAVTELGIQVLEIIPDGDGGWVQRPRAIQIDGLEE